MLKGMINDKYRIVMQIYMDVKNVSGSYYYVKTAVIIHWNYPVL